MGMGLKTSTNGIWRAFNGSKSTEMLNSLANMLRMKPSEQIAAAPAPRPARPVAAKKEEAPTFKSLAMPDEIREALFPTTPRMISVVFDRPVSKRGTLPAAPDRESPIV